MKTVENPMKTKMTFQCRREKPFEILRCSRKRSLRGPESLEQISIKALAVQILMSLDSEGQEQTFEGHRWKVPSLPKVLVSELERLVLRQAEVHFSTKKFEVSRLKIFEFFFDPEILTKLSLDEFLRPLHWSSMIFGRFSKPESASLRLSDLTLSSSDHFDVDDEFELKSKLAGLLKNLPLLERVHLNGHWVDDDCLHSVAKNASSKLRSVKISNESVKSDGDTGLTDDGIVDFVDELLSRNVALKSFDVGQWHPSDQQQISAKGILFLGKMKSLEEVHFNVSHLSYVDIVFDQHRQVVDAGNYIRSVHLCGNSSNVFVSCCVATQDIVASICRVLGQLFPRMERLHLKSLSAQASKPLMSKFGDSIRSLSLHQLKDMDAVAALCPNLESLTISDPELGLKWDQFPLPSLKNFTFDDSSFFINFDLITQVRLIVKTLTAENNCFCLLTTLLGGPKNWAFSC